MSPAPTHSALTIIRLAVTARLRALAQPRTLAVYVHDIVMAGVAFVLAFYLDRKSVV